MRRIHGNRTVLECHDKVESIRLQLIDSNQFLPTNKNISDVGCYQVLYAPKTQQVFLICPILQAVAQSQ